MRASNNYRIKCTVNPHLQTEAAQARSLPSVSKYLHLLGTSASEGIDGTRGS